MNLMNFYQHDDYTVVIKECVFILRNLSRVKGDNIWSQLSTGSKVWQRLRTCVSQAGGRAVAEYHPIVYLGGRWMDILFIPLETCQQI